MHDGRRGVKRKKFLGEMTMTLYKLVSSFLRSEMEPQPEPTNGQRMHIDQDLNIPRMTRVFFDGSGAGCSAGVLN